MTMVILVLQVYKGLLCNLYPVAIKVVSDTTVTQKRNFKREVKILSNLRCPNVLSFVGACHLPGCTALISEFCQRGDLFHALAADRETRMLSWHRRSATFHVICKGKSCGSFIRAPEIPGGFPQNSHIKIMKTASCTVMLSSMAVIDSVC